MRYDKTFYLCAGEKLIVRRVDGPHKGCECFILNYDKNDTTHKDLDSVVSMVEKEWPNTDYCVVQGFWDNGNWAITAVIECTDVERVERVE